jgi:hypothetical protein
MRSDVAASSATKPSSAEPRVCCQGMPRKVSQGMSNKEVAAQCWVSPRTIQFHLRNLFMKTGVTSRGELGHLDRS